MADAHPRCPKCGSRLYLEEEEEASVLEPTVSDWACMTCGWRRTLTLAQLAARGITHDTGRNAGPHLPGE